MVRSSLQLDSTLLTNNIGNLAWFCSEIVAVRLISPHSMLGDTDRPIANRIRIHNDIHTPSTSLARYQHYQRQPHSIRDLEVSADDVSGNIPYALRPPSHHLPTRPLAQTKPASSDRRFLHSILQLPVVILSCSLTHAEAVR